MLVFNDIWLQSVATQKTAEVPMQACSPDGHLTSFRGVRIVAAVFSWIAAIKSMRTSLHREGDGHDIKVH